MSELEATCLAIRWQHRQRVFAMDQRKRADLALGAFLRLALGWRKDLPAEARKSIAARASALVAFVERQRDGKPAKGADPFGVMETPLRDVIAAALAARAPFDAIEKATVKEMERLARALPVWPAFGADVRGFGARSLAVIVAEAGDLSLYPKKGHLWKRMGLAVLDGVRQGGLKKTAAAADWVRHGYNRQRRAAMFVIGDVLMKTAGPYREHYLARKAYEVARADAAGLAVLPAAKITAKNAAGSVSQGHLHRRAQRHMEKRLLHDLWRAWRETLIELPDRAILAVSPAEIQVSPS